MTVIYIGEGLEPDLSVYFDECSPSTHIRVVISRNTRMMLLGCFHSVYP
jgi:hypothetical protein